MKFNYDTIVIGAGHAGSEAAMAAAKLGADVLLITMDMGKIASMSCNPAVGGVAKGQIVREIDALGGMMAIITDATTIQFRMLGRSKGAAMWSPRAQCDKYRFSETWRSVLDSEPRISIWQDSVVDIITDAGVVCGVKTAFGAAFFAPTVILTAGTFLSGLMHVGTTQSEGGRAGDMASIGITEKLIAIGFEVSRMKTGTPVRIDGRTIDFSQLEQQQGDDNPSKFSFLSSSKPVSQQMPCYTAYTSARVHETLRTGFDRSPLFTGVIRGIGPRYCPSIEDKLRTFADKTEHQLFLEPEGRTTNEYYLNGFSSSLPLEVQLEALRQIKGLEHAQIYRPGYAIEYDFFPPTQLRHTLETKLIAGLYFAGQVNGTTGYEEAAAQGLMAGINAALRVRGGGDFILGRDEAYIGVLIDDLVTKGVDEPYRMFTSRAEYRILLRQDNADERLTPRGREIGLVDDTRYAAFEASMGRRAEASEYLRQNSASPEELSCLFARLGQPNITQRRPLCEILLRNDVTLFAMKEHLSALTEKFSSLDLTPEEQDSIEIGIKYSGYIERERLAAQKVSRLEHIRIPAGFKYEDMLSLTIEARQKLSRMRPETIGVASRIPGVSPADINALLIYFGR